MTNYLFIPYELGDTDSRPLPPGANFWSSPGVYLDGGLGPSTYVPNGDECLIEVEVQNNQPAGQQFLSVYVEVWVCNPATIVGPDSALNVAQGSTTNYLTGQANLLAGGSSTVIPIYGFFPYAGISTAPGGHACLIANCWGSNGPAEGPPVPADGQSLIGSTTANFVSLVQTDGHVAQHNIFAAAMPMHMKRQLSFPFDAVTAVGKGEEKVVLEIEHLTKDGGLTKGDLAFLRKGPYRDLQLHASKEPLRAFGIDGCKGGPARRVPLELHARRPVPLTIMAEAGPDERVGGVHTFNVIQKSASGHVHGGVHVLAVIT